jgi:hypothetical protein
MAKSLIALVWSIIVTILLCIRLLSAKSAGDIVVIGFLTLFVGMMSIYLIFEKRIKRSDLFYKYQKFCHENKVVMFYMAAILLMLILEVFFIIVPVVGQFYNVIKIILISFFFISICILLILVRRQSR